MEYIFILALVALLAIITNIETDGNKQYSSIFVGVVSIVLFYFAVSRDYSVGNDTLIYAQIYTRIASYDFIDLFKDANLRYEKGYVLLNWLLSRVFQSDRAILVVVAFLSLFGFMRAIVKYSKYVWLSVFLFVSLAFFGHTLNVYRQILAVVILLNSFNLLRTSTKKYLACVCLAALFHRTAIIFLILPLLMKVKLNLYSFIAAFALSIVLSIVVYKYIIPVVLVMFYDGFGYDTESNGGYGLLMLLLGSTLLGFLYRDEEDETGELLLRIIALGTCLQVLSLQVSIFSRIVFYCQSFLVLYLPYVLYQIEHKKIRLLAFVLLLLFSIYFFVKYFLTDAFSIGVIPYTYY